MRSKKKQYTEGELAKRKCVCCKQKAQFQWDILGRFYPVCGACTIFASRRVLEGLGMELMQRNRLMLAFQREHKISLKENK